MPVTPANNSIAGTIRRRSRATPPACNSWLQSIECSSRRIELLVQLACSYHELGWKRGGRDQPQGDSFQLMQVVLLSQEALLQIRASCRQRCRSAVRCAVSKPLKPENAQQGLRHNIVEAKMCFLLLQLTFALESGAVTKSSVVVGALPWRINNQFWYASERALWAIRKGMCRLSCQPKILLRLRTRGWK